MLHLALIIFGIYTVCICSIYSMTYIRWLKQYSLACLDYVFFPIVFNFKIWCLCFFNACEMLE